MVPAETLVAPVAARRPVALAPSERPKASSPYLVGPAYDWLFFLLPPTLALVLGISISSTALVKRPLVFHGQVFSWASLLTGMLVHAHLLAVVFRSHGNPRIFATHKLRFLVVPPLLYVGLVSSQWIMVVGSLLATLWDVYHSGAQTFGFARIYDAKVGNPSDAGRRLDFWLNQLLYAGPILAGATMLDHLKDFNDFAAVKAQLLTRVPALMDHNQRYLTWTVLIGGTLFVGYYLFAWNRLYRRGCRVSRQKVFLLASTGLCSVWTWGFNPFAMAFVIMNLFHAVQYLALVWWAERENMVRIFSVGRFKRRKGLAACLFLAAIFSYGYFVQAIHPTWTALWAVTLVVSLMHFWYDGFVWSVRAKQI